MSEIFRYWPVLVIAALMVGLIVSFFSGIWIIFVAISGISALGFAVIAAASITTIGVDLAFRREVPAALISLERGDSIEARRDPKSSNLTSDTKYEVKVRFRYEIAGKPFEGQHYGRATVYMLHGDFEDLERELRSDHLRAYASIDRPTDAFLSFQWAERLTAVLLGALGAAVFSLPLWFWWHRT